MSGVIFIGKRKSINDNEYTEKFRAATLQELIDAHNRQVGVTAWVSARGRYLMALKEEFAHRGFSITKGSYLSLDRKIRLSDDEKVLVQVVDGD